MDTEVSPGKSTSPTGSMDTTEQVAANVRKDIVGAAHVPTAAPAATTSFDFGMAMNFDLEDALEEDDYDEAAELSESAKKLCERSTKGGKLRRNGKS